MQYLTPPRSLLGMSNQHYYSYYKLFVGDEKFVCGSMVGSHCSIVPVKEFYWLVLGNQILAYLTVVLSSMKVDTKFTTSIQMVKISGSQSVFNIMLKSEDWRYLNMQKIVRYKFFALWWNSIMGRKWTRAYCGLAMIWFSVNLSRTC